MTWTGWLMVVAISVAVPLLLGLRERNRVKRAERLALQRAFDRALDAMRAEEVEREQA